MVAQVQSGCTVDGMVQLQWSHEDPLAVELLLMHPYTGENFQKLHPQTILDPLTTATILGRMVLVFKTAATYGATTLRNMFLLEIDEELSHNWAVPEYVKMLNLVWPRNVNHIISSGDDGDRDILLRHAFIHREELEKRKEYRRFLSSNMNFTFEVIRYAAEHLLVD
ncbi:MAG: hypothetical protein Q9160_005537 [Pyrenula sp. 1 TL-2023]